MAKRETRRVNPIARITFVVVMVLLVFEGLIIAGVLELHAQTVAKYAPWAYEPFLRFVGEHPESAARWAAVEEGGEDVNSTAGVSGIEPSAIPVLIETDEAALSTNLIIEATVPLEAESEPDPVPSPANAPKNDQEEIVPVG